ncbi:hypothetical protein EPI10_005580 [Gossypium australe]|uniref:Uncharacterized protein n=1 Tax=Gossypium australe TaxID=47621 RepID=A0A5B6WRD2_9ROSI|nr:hypothetical protein EPI10_005580 [Gossypium australe]
MRMKILMSFGGNITNNVPISIVVSKATFSTYGHSTLLDPNTLNIFYPRLNVEQCDNFDLVAFGPKTSQMLYICGANRKMP